MTPDAQSHRNQSALYRQTFVGREPELRQLQASFDDVLAGQGALVAVLGDPGIGKTSLCEQLAAHAASHGGRTLVGHCYEAGSLSLPYLPFVEALRGYVLDRDVDTLRAELGDCAAEVARIVPELRDRVPAPDRPPADPEQERWRLLQSVADFLRIASQAQPLVIVLEDLHDADRGTLDLLLHLSRNLQGTRTLLLGTYRDVEVDRTHPLSGTLAELRRSSQFLRMPLRGLTADEVQRMLAAMSQQEIPWRFSELVHRQTEGNPLFVQEVLRFLVEQGLVESREGMLPRVGEEALAGRIPEGLRDVIGKRLSRLSARANQVLTVAAVLGREFRLEVLLRVVQLPEEEVIAALEEAVRAALVENQPSARGTVAYRFTHAFFRQTLYEEISAPRRIRWHQLVAGALEQVFEGRSEEHAAELAEHFAHSSDAENLAKAVAYGQLAATRAMRVYAYGEAVRQLEQALEVQDVLDPHDAQQRCDLLLALGEAMLPTDQPRRIADTVAAEAFALAESGGDERRAARAAIQALDALFRGGWRGRWQINFDEWVVRADRSAAEGTVERIYADVYLAFLGGVLRVRPGHDHLRRAVTRARQLGDEAAYLTAAGHALTFLNALQDLDLVEQLADEFRHRPHAAVRPADLAAGLEAMARRLLGRARREPAEHAWRELDRLAAESRDPTAVAHAASARALQAFIDGDLEAATSVGQDAVRLASVVGWSLTWSTGRIAPVRMLPTQALFYMGRLTEALASEFQGSSRPELAERALALSFVGKCDDVHAIRMRFDSIGAPEDETALWILAFLLEASIRCGDAQTAEILLERLSPVAGRLQTWYCLVSFGRLLGEAATLLGRTVEARGLFEQALEVCRMVQFRPELALIRLDLAEVLLENFVEERSAALQQLHVAIDEFRDMQMQPSLERALRLVEAAPTHPSPTPADALTAREREVARLLASGLSNRDISAALVISEGTAEVHVKHILGKLGFRSRSQAAVWAAEHGLAPPSNPPD